MSEDGLLIAAHLGRQGLSPALLTLYNCAIILAVALGHLITAEEPFVPKFAGSVLPIILLNGVAGYFANWGMMHALAGAPNPGFAVGVVNANLVVVLLASAALYGTPILWTQFVGAIAMVVGTVLVAWN